MLRARQDSLWSFAGSLLALLLLFGGMWVALQGRFTLAFPYKFANITNIIAESGLTVLALWIAAAGLGMPLSRTLAPAARRPWIAQLGAGMAAMLLISWLLALAGLLNMWTAWGLCAIGAGMLFWQMADRRLRPWWEFEAWPNPPWTLLLLLPCAGLLFVATMCPPGTLWLVEGFGYDVKSYHLQLPREWLDRGAMLPLEHNVYGYLPSLMEAGYMQIGAMQGNVYLGIYAAQLFHASFIAVTALALASMVSAYAGRAAGCFGAAAFIATPWTIITGSLAYNEMAVLFFAAVAMQLIFDSVGTSRGGAVLIGLLLGAATLAKLTAAVFVALPLIVLLLARWSNALQWRPTPDARSVYRAAAIVVAVMLLTVSPWLIRNAAWTGNPVFPFAQSVFGHAHWTPELAERWAKAHSTQSHSTTGAEALLDHWLLNAGYGAIGGGQPNGVAGDVARFHREGGIPILWLTALAGAIVLQTSPKGRRAALAMVAMIVIQLLVWYFLTHRQSRFLVPTLLPGCVLVGMGFGRLEQLLRPRMSWALPTIASLIAALLTVNCFDIARMQTHPQRLPDGTLTLPPLGEMVDTIPRRSHLPTQPGQFEFGDHPVNFLPVNSLTYMVSDAGSMLYVRRRAVYHTAFDASPLGDALRRHKGDPVKVTLEMIASGITHVWINVADLRRLQGSYGFDPDVTERKLGELIRTGWQPVTIQAGGGLLFRLPQVRQPAAEAATPPAQPTPPTPQEP